MDLTEDVVKNIVANTKTAKETAFLEDPEFCDLVPGVAVVGSDGVTLLTISLVGVPHDDYPIVIGMAGAAAESFVVQFGEAYQLASPATEGLTPEDLPVGKLEERFKAGDESVFECVMVHAADNSGNYAFVALPYVRKEGKIEWVDKDEEARLVGPDDKRYGGYMCEAVRSAMGRQNVKDYMAQMAPNISFGLTERQKELHTACVAAKFALNRKWQVAFSVQDPDELALIKRSVQHGPFSGGGWSMAEFTT